MRRTIPQAVLAVVADFISSAETHASLDSLLMYAGCPGDPPSGSKHVKALSWLRATNAAGEVDPLAVLGKVVEVYMDKPLRASDWDYESVTAFRAKFTETIGAARLQYLSGGVVTGSLAAPTRNLHSYIKERNVRALSEEFDRAAAKAESEPREAVSAAANILESLCKHYIEERQLGMPSKQVLGTCGESCARTWGLTLRRWQTMTFEPFWPGSFKSFRGSPHSVRMRVAPTGRARSRTGSSPDTHASRFMPPTPWRCSCWSLGKRRRRQQGDAPTGGNTAVALH